LFGLVLTLLLKLIEVFNRQEPAGLFSVCSSDDRHLVIPHDPDIVETILEKVLIAEAAMVAYWGSYEAAEALLGFPSTPDAGEPYDDADPVEVDLWRFRATPLIETNHDWTFQIGNPEAFGPESWDDLGLLMEGASAGTISTMSPMGGPDSALRGTIGTAVARWKFEFETWLPLSVG
jgi:hypothetical protein